MPSDTLFFIILVSGSLLSALLAFLGVLATLRRMSFFGDGIAHASLAGIALGIIIGINPLLAAIVFSACSALVIFFLTHKAHITSDASIGVLFPAGMSIGVILTALTKREHIELEDFLFGDILSVERGDLGIVIVVSALLIILGFFLWRSLMIMSIDRDDAWLSGISVDLVDAVFHVILAVAVVLGANMLGIVLASAMLVIPATAAKALAHSFRGLTIITIILAEITMIGGLFLSRIFSLPSGAIIVLTGVLVLVFSACISRLRSA